MSYLAVVSYKVFSSVLWEFRPATTVGGNPTLNAWTLVDNAGTPTVGNSAAGTLTQQFDKTSNYSALERFVIAQGGVAADVPIIRAWILGLSLNLLRP